MSRYIFRCILLIYVAHIFFRTRNNLDKTRIAADNKAVSDVIQPIETMINPFDNDYQGLVHLASGAVATSTVTDDMKTMLIRDESTAVDFMKMNIVGEEYNIYMTIKKTGLKTFSSIGKKGQIVALKNSKILFAKMLLIARSRNLEMEEVLMYSLRPYPHPLATNEGDLVKTVKAKLLHTIEEEVKDGSVELPVGNKAYILDARQYCKHCQFFQPHLENLQKIYL